jgi:hypothetical protein
MSRNRREFHDRPEQRLTRGDKEKQTFVKTSEGIILSRSIAWPLPSPYAGYVDLEQFTETQLSAYMIPSNSIESMKNVAKFLTRLLITPRQEIAANRGNVEESFLGMEAPEGTSAHYKNCKKNQLNSAGAREMTAIHVTMLRRIREQIAPGRFTGDGKDRPKLSSLHGSSGKCPFGPSCLFLLYSAIVARFISMTQCKSTFIIHFAQNAMDDKRIPSMQKVPLTPTGCHCPFSHDEEDMSVIERFTDVVIDHMVDEFPTQCWPIVNKEPVYASHAGLVQTGRFSLDNVRAAFTSIGDMRKDLIGLAAIASLDNVSDSRLLSIHDDQPDKLPSLFAQLNEINHQEYVAWKRNGSVSHTSLPYQGYLDIGHFIQLEMREDKKSAEAIWKETNEKLKAFRDEESIKIQEAEAELENAKKESESRIRAISDAIRTEGTRAEEAKANAEAKRAKEAEAEAKARAARVERPVAPVSISGDYRHPEYGNAFVPRMVTEDFIRTKGFKFEVYHSISSPTERQRYVFDRLFDLYQTYIPGLGPAGHTAITIKVISENFSDPYRIFDYGIGYVQLLYGNPRIQQRLVIGA